MSGRTGRVCRWGYVCDAGVCVGVMAAEGTVCELDAVDGCAPGLVCANRGLSSSTCRPLVGDGERCGADVQCPAGSVCVGIGDGVCGPPPALDEPCSRNSRCAEGLTCVASASGDVCARAPRLEGDHCAIGGCPSGMHCVSVGYPERVCLVDLAEGSDCDGDRDGAAQCGDGTFCDRGTDTCVRIGAMGETCPAASSEACEGGLVCQPVSGEDVSRCLPPASEGDSCRDGAACGPNTLCDVDSRGLHWPTHLTP